MPGHPPSRTSDSPELEAWLVIRGQGQAIAASRHRSGRRQAEDAAEIQDLDLRSIQDVDMQTLRIHSNRRWRPADV